MENSDNHPNSISPNSGRDSSNPVNYCPIALTSCLCKTLVCTVNKRLVWFLESNKLITNSLCGFRKRRTTIDHVIKLKTHIREDNIQKQHLIAVGSTFTNLHKQEVGVPQGSILSVTLVIIKINSITKCLTPGIEDFLLADDFCITSRSTYVRTAEHQLQQCIWKFSHWANTNDFTISKRKTRWVHFLN